LRVRNLLIGTNLIDPVYPPEVKEIKVEDIRKDFDELSLMVLTNKDYISYLAKVLDIDLSSVGKTENITKIVRFHSSIRGPTQDQTPIELEVIRGN
jgi:hypothetical protein